jgi:hypothetical protein
MRIEYRTARGVHARVLAHLLTHIGAADACQAPFSHVGFDEAFPADVYAAMLADIPPADRYSSGPPAPNVPRGARRFFNLTITSIRQLPETCRDLWLGVAAALAAPELKRALYAKLAPDLIYRYGVEQSEVPDLAGHSRPTLYRDGEGFELPPHPDTLKKVVTMHLYLPADLSQLDLGTALYRREPGPQLEGDRWAGFAVAKEFAFRPNSGYAFVVNDGPVRQSWHGRAPLPAGAGIRNSLLNTFYSEPRREYSGYLEGEATDPVTTDDA